MRGWFYIDVIRFDIDRRFYEGSTLRGRSLNLSWRKSESHGERLKNAKRKSEHHVEKV